MTRLNPDAVRSPRSSSSSGAMPWNASEKNVLVEWLSVATPFLVQRLEHAKLLTLTTPAISANPLRIGGW